MVIKKQNRSKAKNQTLKGHGSGRISYKARTSSHDLNKFFEEEEESKDKEEE